jgi:hypothetical protein
MGVVNICSEYPDPHLLFKHTNPTRSTSHVTGRDLPAYKSCSCLLMCVSPVHEAMPTCKWQEPFRLPYHSRPRSTAVQPYKFRTIEHAGAAASHYLCRCAGSIPAGPPSVAGLSATSGIQPSTAPDSARSTGSQFNGMGRCRHAAGRQDIRSVNHINSHVSPSSYEVGPSCPPMTSESAYA